MGLIKDKKDGIEDILDNSAKFRYMMLSRFVGDAKYYLANGGRSERVLWSGNAVEHADNMVRLYDSFSEDEKPEWLTREELDSYVRELYASVGKSLDESRPVAGKPRLSESYDPDNQASVLAYVIYKHAEEIGDLGLSAEEVIENWKEDFRGIGELDPADEEAVDRLWDEVCQGLQELLDGATDESAAVSGRRMRETEGHIGVGDYVANDTKNVKGRVMRVYRSFWETDAPEVMVKSLQRDIGKSELSKPWADVMVHGGGAILCPVSQLECIPKFEFSNNRAEGYFGVPFEAKDFTLSKALRKSFIEIWLANVGGGFSDMVYDWMDSNDTPMDMPTTAGKISLAAQTAYDDPVFKKFICDRLEEIASVFGADKENV